MLARDFPKVFAAALLLTPLPALAATPPALQAEQSPAMPAPAGNRMGRGGKLAGFLTPQQRAVLLLSAQGQIKDMTPAQKQAFRKDQVKKILSMSDSERQKFKTDLQARWDALPPGQKNRLEQRLARQQAGQVPDPAAQ